MRTLGVGLTAALLAVACGGDDDGAVADPGGSETTATTAPAATTDEPGTAPDGSDAGSAASGALLEVGDLPEGFGAVGSGALFAGEPLCEGGTATEVDVVEATGIGFATDDFMVAVNADSIVTNGQAETQAAWLLAELGRCDGVDNSEYVVDQVGDSTWTISTSVDFGAGVEPLGTSWMTVASADTVVAVHVFDGGLSDIDGAALLATVASRAS